MKALIVDDSRAMRTFLVHHVHEFKLETTEAADGIDALDCLRVDPFFDVALVDWEMPRMDGLAFVKAVRADHAFDDMKIMMVTSLNAMEQVAVALEQGANDFLMKPVTPESLEDKLRLLGVVA